MIRLLLALSTVAVAAAASAEDDLTALLEPIRAEHRLPALAGAILEGGRVTAIGATGLARLGGSYIVSLTNAAASLPAVLLVGSSRSSSVLGSLPLSLTTIGAGPGCMLYASSEFLFPTVTDTGGGASVTLTVPSCPVLEDASLYHTWLAVDPGAPLNPLGLTSSNGLEARIGPPTP